MKRTFTISIIVVLLIIGVSTAFISQLPDWSPTYTNKIVEFNSSAAPLYIRSKYWGVSADHSFTVLSTKSENSETPDSTSEFVYHDVSFLFYRTSNDSLWLYVYSKTKVPTIFKSNIKVMQVELANPTMMKIFHSHQYKGKTVIEYR